MFLSLLIVLFNVLFPFSFLRLNPVDASYLNLLKEGLVKAENPSAL